MTTVAFRDGIMAADSRYSETTVGATRGPKIFRKKVGKREVLIGISGGDTFAAMLFVDWYGSSNDAMYKTLTALDGDAFDVLVWDGRKLWEVNPRCRPCEIEEPYYAIGSGAVHAITAMDCGKSAIQAVRLAARRDPATGGRIIAMSLTRSGKR